MTVLCVAKEAKSMEYNAAIYCRLSQDDGSVGESGSIQTQKTLLTQYCTDHHITIGGYYCDDGWSGTNFDRPDFKRMLDDIEAGAINMRRARNAQDYISSVSGTAARCLWKRSTPTFCLQRMPRFMSWTESPQLLSVERTAWTRNTVLREG